MSAAHLIPSGMGILLGIMQGSATLNWKYVRGKSTILVDSWTVELIWSLNVCDFFLTKQEELWLLKKEEPRLMIECWWGRHIYGQGTVNQWKLLQIQALKKTCRVNEMFLIYFAREFCKGGLQTWYTVLNVILPIQWHFFFFLFPVSFPLAGQMLAVHK